MMPKSQSDAETVEQAIDRLIAVHNDDSQAHIGPGRSLTEHRINDVIDHPSGSILADKIAARQIWFDYSLYTLEGWAGVGAPFILRTPGVEISTPSGTAATYFLYAQPVDTYNWFDWSKNMYFEAFVQINAINGRYRAFNIGGSVGDNVLGFRWESNKLWADCKINGVDHSEEIVGAVVSGLRNFRAYVDPPTGEVRYEIDGTLVKSIAGLTLVGADTSGVTISTKRVSGVTDTWAIYNMVHGRDL